MPCTALERPLGAKAWELRSAWAVGRRVSLRLEGCDMDRIEGHVTKVAATNATVHVGAILVPMDRVLSVHNPSRLGDSTARASWAGRAIRVEPQREQLWRDA
jgi:hypothetical protein